MDFTSFFTLFVIAAAVASIYHLFLRYRFLDGYDALLGKVILGWFGASFGSLVLGNWLWKIEDVYLLPAILGAFAAIHIEVLICKALAKLVATLPKAAVEETRPPKLTVAA